MENLLLQKKQIDGDYTVLYLTKYMLGEWGIEVGYNTIPPYLANMRKRLCDYQQLHSIDCNGELQAASLVLQSTLISDPSGIQTSDCTTKIVSTWRPCC